MALGDELLRSVTLPLDVALETLRQPVSPMLDAGEYANNVDKQRFERNLPNFFREISRKLGEAQQVAIAQQDAMATEYGARGIADRVALSNPPGGARFVPNEAGQRSGTSSQIDPNVIDSIAKAMQAEQGGNNAVPPSAGGVITYQDKPYTLDTKNNRLVGQTDPNDIVPIEIKDGEILIRGPELSAPSVSGSKVGRFLGGIKNVATQALAPVGNAVEGAIENVGSGITRIPLPGAEKVGTAVESLPLAAAKFKETFGQEFEQKTGQPIGFETALAAINKYGLRDTVNRLASVSDTVLTNYTIDPILNATLPEWAADPLVKATGVGASMLPYLAISIANPVAGAALGSTFALSATEDIKNLTAEYQRGNIDGKTFMLGVGLDLLDIVPEVAGPLVRSARRGFTSRRALAEAMDVVEGAKVASAGKTPEQIAALTSDAEALDAAKTAEGGVAGESVVPAEEIGTTQTAEAAPVSDSTQIDANDTTTPTDLNQPVAPVSAVSAEPDIRAETPNVGKSGQEVEPAATVREVGQEPDARQSMAVRERERITTARQTHEPVEQGLEGSRVFTTTKAPDPTYDSGSYFYRPDEGSYVGSAGVMKHSDIESITGLTARELSDRGWVRMTAGRNKYGLSGALPEDVQQAARSLIRDGADPQTETSFDFDVNDTRLPFQNGSDTLVRVARGQSFGEAIPAAEALPAAEAAPAAEAVPAQAVEAAPVEQAATVAEPARADSLQPVTTKPPRVDQRERSEQMRDRGQRKRRYPVANLPPDVATPTPSAVAAQSARSADLRVSRELDDAAKGDAGLSAKGNVERGATAVSPEAVRVRDNYRQQAANRSTSDLQRRIEDPATPAWQKRESVLEVERRTARAEAHSEQWKKLTPYQQRLAKAQGYSNEPPLPAPKVHRVSQAMSELSPKMTVPEVSAWLRRNADIVGDPDRYLDKGSNYWVKSRKGKVLDLGRVLTDVRQRVEATSGVSARTQGVDTPILDALRIKTKTFADGTLGICRI